VRVNNRSLLQAQTAQAGSDFARSFSFDSRSCWLVLRLQLSCFCLSTAWNCWICGHRLLGFRLFAGSRPCADPGPRRSGASFQKALHIDADDAENALDDVADVEELTVPAAQAAAVQPLGDTVQ